MAVLVAYHDLTGRGYWLFIFHARPVSFRYTSHVTAMLTYLPDTHALLAVSSSLSTLHAGLAL